MPRTQTVNINTQVSGTMAQSTYHAEETEIIDDEYTTGEDVVRRFGAATITETRGFSAFMTGDRDGWPGFLEAEIYRLRVKPGGSQSASRTTEYPAQRTYLEQIRQVTPDFLGGPSAAYSWIWTLARSLLTSNFVQFEQLSKPIAFERLFPPRSIPDPESTGPFPNLPGDPIYALISRLRSYPSQSSQLWNPSGNDYSSDLTPPPWQRIHQRLLGWAIIWPMSEIDAALTSTTRGQQVDDVSLSIWATQTYKRYLRSRMTDTPGGRVDRLFVAAHFQDSYTDGGGDDGGPLAPAVIIPPNAQAGGRSTNGPCVPSVLYYVFGLMNGAVVVKCSNTHQPLAKQSLPSGLHYADDHILEVIQQLRSRDNALYGVLRHKHGDVEWTSWGCGMLRELWAPFGFEGAPKLVVVLAKHRSDANHWVVHRFSLPVGALTTYDSYPERTLPDGRYGSLRPNMRHDRAKASTNY
ncbi:hypothetical protein HYDPIDRAFT_25210 [Hydnomerulius pinastri MD-312]|nr:hypothetical protein HYDPIDRAFT_25210 [Hydnomerulius pinastri MD-312]